MSTEQCAYCDYKSESQMQYLIDKEIVNNRIENITYDRVLLMEMLSCKTVDIRYSI